VTLARASIVDLEYFSKGIKLALVDETGRIVLLVWQDVLEEIPERYQLRASNEVQVTGVIDQYQSELEIVPRRSEDVIVVEATSPMAAKKHATGDISAVDEGRIVTVEGMMSAMEGDSWQKIWLDDGTGQVLVFVPQRVAEYIPANLQLGQQVRVTGEIDIYNGQVEIVPLAGRDVELP
jgi:DNA/RNA endonuclease YhcR with UshA esterase domain